MVQQRLNTKSRRMLLKALLSMKSLLRLGRSQIDVNMQGTTTMQDIDSIIRDLESRFDWKSCGRKYPVTNKYPHLYTQNKTRI
jgi:hypothetical protein